MRGQSHHLSQAGRKLESLEILHVKIQSDWTPPSSLKLMGSKMWSDHTMKNPQASFCAKMLTFTHLSPLAAPPRCRDMRMFSQGKVWACTQVDVLCNLSSVHVSQFACGAGGHVPDRDCVCVCVLYSPEFLCYLVHVQRRCFFWIPFLKTFTSSTAKMSAFNYFPHFKLIWSPKTELLRHQCSKDDSLLQQ